MGAKKSAGAKTSGRANKSVRDNTSVGTKTCGGASIRVVAKTSVGANVSVGDNTSVRANTSVGTITSEKPAKDHAEEFTETLTGGSYSYPLVDHRPVEVLDIDNSTVVQSKGAERSLAPTHIVMINHPYS